MNGNARDLVRRAFMLARNKGKPDWHRMSLAVLKNRLLDITDRNFNEASYGAANFKEFVERLQDQLRIDPNTFPPTVELIADLDQEAPQEEASGRAPVSIYKGDRIRPDLWKAVLDWNEEVTYVWDPAQRRVRKVEGAASGTDVLPRISRADCDVLQAAFVKESRGALDPQARDKLEAWGAHKYPTTALPGDLATRWHAVLAKEVGARLRNWLRDREAPADAEALDDKLDHYRDAGDTLAIGELLARSFSTATGPDVDRILANVIANWASVRPLAVEVPSTRDLIPRIDNFTPSQLALAVIHAASRLREVGIELPAEVGDLAYRLLGPLKNLFGLSDKIRRSDVVSAATAMLDEAFAGLRDAVNGFRRTTSVTAKQPSIEVLKQAHRYSEFALQTELPLLREVETLLGPVFRKFCESCERHEPSGVLRRASELRQHIERVQGGYDAEPPYALWSSVLLPVFEHVSSLVEEGTRATDRFTAPQLGIVGGTFKLDLSLAHRPTTFPVRVRNDGQGMAYGVRLLGGSANSEAHLELSEPSQAFDLMPGSERLVSLSLTIQKQSAFLAVPVEWTCVTVNGKTCGFEQVLQFEQQSSQPDWEALQSDPPYAINPIRKREHLYGRDAVITDLALLVSAATSTFLWGQKRVGKTSVLQVLSSELSSRRDIACVTLRMGELAALHEGQIAHTIASRLCEAVGLQPEIPPEDSFGAGLGRLVPFIERLAQALPRHRFVVIIDEFDDLDASFYTGERGRQFVKALRSLSEVGLAFFFVGSERMNAIYQSHASDLNKWANFWLDRIESYEDCAALITKPVEGVIEYHATAVKSIVRYCGGNPFYMHLLCSQVFRRCMHERRTYVGESDVDDVRRGLLRILGPTNFAHFWEDNPALVSSEKQRQTAENCLFLSCIASLGGSYESCEDLLEAQQALQLNASQSLPRDELRKIEARLVRRRVIVNNSEVGGGFVIALPILSDWLIANAESQLLPAWHRYIEEQAQAETQKPAEILSLASETGPFPIAEDELLPVSQRLVYLGKQIDVAEVRRWLRQFDDDNRIEVAFQLLKRLAERGYVSDGAAVSGLARMQEALNERRARIGGGAWTTVRRRLDNLCVTFVDSEAKSGAHTARELAKRMQPGKCGPIQDAYGWLQNHREGDPMVVIADDFSGTGDTLARGVRRLWKLDETMLTSLAKEGRVICCLQTAFPESLQRLKSEFPYLQVLVMKMFDEEVKAFDPEAAIFESEGERKFALDVVLQIGRQLTQQMPLGYGDMAGLVAFHSTIPNNTLPIFWSSGTVNNRHWNPLLPRASF